MDVHPHTPSDGGMSRLSKSLGDRPPPDTLVSGHGFNLPWLAVDGEFLEYLARSGGIISVHHVKLSAIPPVTVFRRGRAHTHTNSWHFAYFVPKPRDSEGRFA